MTIQLTWLVRVRYPLSDFLLSPPQIKAVPKEFTRKRDKTAVITSPYSKKLEASQINTKQTKKRIEFDNPSASKDIEGKTKDLKLFIFQIFILRVLRRLGPVLSMQVMDTLFLRCVEDEDESVKSSEVIYFPSVHFAFSFVPFYLHVLAVWAKSVGLIFSYF
ncbi:hypothetical protein FQR65_LT07668 [Abscondita terminalis]|nr:hypothetical protein FQR65_LT07668 [Abscondita terminalis]